MPRPRPEPSKRRAAATGALAALVFASSLIPAAAHAAETIRFEPIGAYDLELDGKVVSGVKMYHSPEAAAVMVVTPHLPYPIALVPRNKTVQKLDPADLQEEPAGSLVWTPKVTPTAVNTFELVDQKPVFDLAGKKIRFLDKPPLLGPQTEAQIFEYDPSYKYHAAKADPPTVYLPVLESWPQDVLVKIYFSSSCQVCKDLLPGIFKTIERIKNPKFKFEFYGMPLPASSDPLGAELKITDFPTGILYSGGKEVARATGYSWSMPDMAIHNALLGIQVNPEALRVDPGAVPPGAKPLKPQTAPRQP